MRSHSSEIFPIFLIALIASGLIAGCAEINKQQIGTGVGAVVGGAIGNLATSGKNQKAATAIGVLAGAAIGNQFGKYLDEKDKAEARAAQQRALDSNRPQVWRNPATGNSGKILVVDRPANQNSPSVAGTSLNPTKSASSIDQRTCKTIRQTITLKDGSSNEEDVTACKGPNGWETV